MFLFAFKTFPRLRELTSPGNNVLQFQDVEFGGEKQNQSVSVTFNNFKHNLCGKPHKISFYTVHRKFPKDIVLGLELLHIGQNKGTVMPKFVL